LPFIKHMSTARIT